MGEITKHEFCQADYPEDVCEAIEKGNAITVGKSSAENKRTKRKCKKKQQINNSSLYQKFNLDNHYYVIFVLFFIVLAVFNNIIIPMFFTEKKDKKLSDITTVNTKEIRSEGNENDRNDTENKLNLS